MNKTFSGGGTKVSRFVAEAELRAKGRGFPNEEEQERKDGTTSTRTDYDALAEMLKGALGQ